VVNGGEKVGGTVDEATQLRARMNERRWQSQMHAGVGKRVFEEESDWAWERGKEEVSECRLASCSCSCCWAALALPVEVVVVEVVD
jgi:hypothetical protein